METTTMSYSVLGIVAVTAVLSTIFLVTDSGETAQVVKPFAKVYMDPQRAYARMYNEEAEQEGIPTRTMEEAFRQVPSLQTTSCMPGYVKYPFPYTTENRQCYISDRGIKCCKKFESNNVLDGYGMPHLDNNGRPHNDFG